VVFGLIAIANATASPFTGEETSISDYLSNINFKYVILQFMWFIVGLIAMFVIMFPDYHNLGDYTVWIYWINIALLILVLLMNNTIRGISGWFSFGDRGFQPSEVAKIAIILTLAKMVSDRTKNKEGITRFRDIGWIVLSFLLPFGLILAQPDFGTAFVYAAIFFGMLFMAKTSIRIIGTIFGAGLIMVPLMWFVVMNADQKQRIIDFFNPTKSASTQVLQAKIAIGSGQVTGKGFFATGALGRLGFVPDDHTDFIFSVTIEPIGFIGGIILLLLYFTLIFRTLYLAIKAKDDFGKYIIIGVVCMILFHVFENIGMNMGMMPVTGIPLPFFSYGGSNMLANMVAFGLVLNVNMRRFRWSF
jgi:rod shape determining protein RodA